MNARILASKALPLVLLAACGSDESGWHQQEGVPRATSFDDVWAFSPDNVWVVGAGGAVLRWDGAAWTESRPGLAGALTGIWALAENKVWVIGDSSVAKWDGQAWAATDLRAMGVDGFTDVWGASDSDVWIVGDDAVYLHWDGTQWRRVQARTTNNNAIWGSGPNDVWAMSVFGVSRWNGSVWTEVQNASVRGEGGIWGFGANDVWMVGDSEEAAHWDGASWKVHGNEDLVGDLGAIWGSAPDDVWAAGSAGAIAHWNGKSWAQVTHQAIGSPFLRIFSGIHGSSADNVWAVGHVLGEGGAQGIIYRHQPN